MKQRVPWLDIKNHPPVPEGNESRIVQKEEFTSCGLASRAPLVTIQAQEIDLKVIAVTCRGTLKPKKGSESTRTVVQRLKFNIKLL
jgi:hypothetical protein